MSRRNETTTQAPGTSWSDEENVQLCKSWKEICHCPATGDEMQTPQMWRKISDHFAANMPGTIRNKGALMSHWRGLNKDFTKWKEALGHAKSNTGSGYALDDEIKHAQLWYASGKGITFIHHSGWDIVKDCKRYKIVVNSDPTPTPDDYMTDFGGEGGSMTGSPGAIPVEVNSADDSDTYHTPTATTHPQGRKAAKASKKQSPNICSQLFETFVKNSAIRLEESRRREEARIAKKARNDEQIRRAEERPIMVIDTRNMTPNTQKFWAEERKDIVNRRRLFKEVQSSSSAENTHWFGEE